MTRRDSEASQYSSHPGMLASTQVTRRGMSEDVAKLLSAAQGASSPAMACVSPVLVSQGRNAEP